ncbi:MAG: Y-family DNA polymerase [Rikenellaceae bacterium]
MIGLCDCNNFFVSCQRVFNPSLNGRPVIVLSSNDGCVIARSNESKALGIKMGQPLFQVRDIVERHKVVLHSTNFPLYGDMSHRVMETLRGELPSIEVYSIDEAFLDMSGIAIEELNEYGQRLSKKVQRNTGIPVSIGIAPTKTLAKIASKLCKSYPKLKGACLLYRPADIEKVLSRYPIEDVWGIGRQSCKMLKVYNIVTAQQFREAPKEWIQAKMGLNGLKTWLELNGQSSILFDERPSDKRSIMVSRSFAHEIYSVGELHSALSGFVSSAAEKLRRQKSVAGAMQVFILTNRHRAELAQHNGSEMITFDTPTQSTIQLASAAMRALRDMFKEGYGYKKAGVILYDIRPSSGVQSSLFDSTDHTKHSKLMEHLDSINSHYGKNSVRLGVQNSDKNRVSSEYLSPYYTTKWSDIIKVKV